MTKMKQQKVLIRVVKNTDLDKCVRELMEKRIKELENEN